MTPFDETKRRAAGFDHNDPVQMQSPHEMYRAFRAECPVGKSENYGGFHFLARYETVRRFFEDYASFTSTDSVGLPGLPHRMPPIDTDPPLQTQYRRLLNQKFSPKAVREMRPDIEAKIHRLIDGFIERGEAEIASELVRPLLPSVVLPFLGIPGSAETKVREGIEAITRKRATDPAGVMEVAAELSMLLIGVVAERRQAPPKDDVIGLLLREPIGGAMLDDMQIHLTLLIILFGGLDTTSSAMLESLLHISRTPEAREHLRRPDCDWELAVEELVRWATPIQALRRTTTKDVEIEGVRIAKGTPVLGLHGSANRDESVFPEADRCILDRKPNPHIAFGQGVHLCIGRPIALLEIECLLKIVLGRLGDFVVASDFRPEYLVGEARGMKRLPIRFTPGTRLGAAT